MDKLQEDLDALTRSDGWQAFTDHVRREWGTREDGGGARFMHATRQASSITADGDAIAQLRQIIVAQREVHNLVAWVEDIVKGAQKHQERPDPVLAYARRGSL